MDQRELTSLAQAEKFCNGLLEYFRQNDDAYVNLTYSKNRSKPRTDQQRKSQFGVIYPQMVDFYTVNQDKLMMDILLFIAPELNVEFMHFLAKNMFNNGKSTTGFDTQANNAYIEAIIAYYLHKHTFSIQPPTNGED